MGFIKAFAGSIGGTFADQWKDYYEPKENITATSALFQAVPHGTNNDRGENTEGSDNIITNGSKIIVPEGTALITLQDGAITGMIAEAGGYEFKSDDSSSQSIFAGNGILSSTINESWERFKFGGQPSSQQLVFYVNLKEIPNNKFGTQSAIYWNDAYLNAQVGAITRGTYTLKIVDPILFVKNFVPATYLQPNAKVFDFQDIDNDASKGNRITNIQSDQVGLATSMAKAVEDAYKWKQDRGLEIVKTAILAIEYDENTNKLLSDVQKADALSGSRGNSFMQQAVARGIESAGSNPNGGAAGMAFMGMGVNAIGGVTNGMNQPNQSVENPFINANNQQEQSNTDKLLEMKKLLDAKAITEEEYNKVKKDLLGL